MKENLKIYKITYKGYLKEDCVFIPAHSKEYAIESFQDCDKDEIISVKECVIADGLILDQPLPL